MVTQIRLGDVEENERKPMGGGLNNPPFLRILELIGTIGEDGDFARALFPLSRSSITAFALEYPLTVPATMMMMMNDANDDPIDDDKCVQNPRHHRLVAIKA